MTELQDYVDSLFRRQPSTPEIDDLKEEIFGNLCAKRDDLMAQGMDAARATELAKESLPDLDFLIDGNQLTHVGAYQRACAQAVLVNCILFWIFSLPLLVIGYAPVSYLGLLLVAVSGGVYLLKRRQPAPRAAFLSVTASRRRRTVAWMLWGLFFLVAAGTMAALTFGSNLWFDRPPHIDGPYQMANIAARFYLPLLTIFIPVTFGNFTTLLIKSRKGQENE